jgi:hypothetical protein
VSLSTGVSFSPDTALRVVRGVSLQEFIRKERPSFHAFLRKLHYVAKGEHRASQGLRKLARIEFAPISAVLREEEIERALDDPSHKVGGPRSSWECVLRGLQTEDDDGTDDVLGKLCHWMTACDAHGFYASDLVRTGDKLTAETHLLSLFGPALEAWKQLNPQLLKMACVPLEVSLMALARMDWEMPRTGSLPTSPRESTVASFLKPGSRPLGHWFKEVSTFSRCENLADLGRALHGKRALYRGTSIDHERLKKWARSKEVLMPREAVQPVLMALQGDVSHEAVKNRFYVARVLTFFCDLVYACTAGGGCTWEQAQAQVENRYTEAYRRHAATVP